jgi:hypothetical protein
MVRVRALARGRAIALAVAATITFLTAGCGSIAFEQRPAHGYEWGSNQPLRIAIIDETGAEWSFALETSLRAYSKAAGGHIQFQGSIQGANIVINVRQYSDANPPQLDGYDFPQGAGGFATIYDAAGVACNYPPSTLPLSCSGEITTAQIWLNQAIPAGSDIEARRVRLIQHELGHALGLTRHAPTLDIAALARRYGWQ